MAEKGEAEPGLAADPTKAFVDDLCRLCDGVRAQVRQLGALEVSPHLLDGVQVIGVGRERLDHEPTALVSDEAFHGPAAVRGEPVPDEGDLVPTEMAVEL